jgi:hypothetical protein
VAFLLTLLRRGLDARPENRFATMPELLGRLEAALRARAAAWLDTHRGSRRAHT